MTNGTHYSFFERTLHNVAFQAMGIQKILSEIEDTVFRQKLSGVDMDPPIFITSLPRAGTTLLLEVISSAKAGVSHSYRNLPFVMCPLFWKMFSKPFQKPAILNERAHKDGLMIGYESVEAFEEVVWHTFWPEKYLPKRILTWAADDKDAESEFPQFFQNHIRKVFMARSAENQQAWRYVSKNNTNLARLDLLRRYFNDAVLIVPFRNPWDQAMSMLHQHQNFLTLHEQDPFSQTYMGSLGHFEFGALHRPMDFNNWTQQEDDLSPLFLDYWLEYWIQAFEVALSQQQSGCLFFSYDRCCTSPRDGLYRLGEAIGLSDVSSLVPQSYKFKAATRYSKDGVSVSKERLSRSENLFRQLENNAIF